MPAGSFTVLTIAHPEAAAFDEAQAFRIVRLGARMLLPTRGLARRVRALAAEVGACLVIFDPAIPLGLIGSQLGGLPYVVMLHGAEVSIPGGLPLVRNALAGVLRGAERAIASSHWVAEQAGRVAGASTPPILVVPPGIDQTRFVPLGRSERTAARRRFGLPEEALLVLSVGRLVPRKGTSTLIGAVSLLVPTRPDLCLVIAGAGRDATRLAKGAARLGPQAVLLGRIPDEALPSLYGCADVFAQPTCTRWAGLEQEGFGIVFLEAAACGLPAVAGRSGGAAEAVEDGVTGLVVERPKDATAVSLALVRLLDDPEGRARLGAQASQRARTMFGYDGLAQRLAAWLDDLTKIGHVGHYCGAVRAQRRPRW